MMKDQAKHCQVELVFVYGDLKMEDLMVDKMRVVQILINLISNAIKFSFEKSQVQVVLVSFSASNPEK